MFPKKPNKINTFNDKKKYILGFMLFVFFMVIAMIAFYYFSIRDVVLRTYSDKAHGAVVLASEILDGDELLRYLDQGYLGEDFKVKDARLKEIKKVFGLKFLYIFNIISSEKFSLILKNGKNQDNFLLKLSLYLLCSNFNISILIVFISFLSINLLLLIWLSSIFKISYKSSSFGSLRKYINSNFIILVILDR